MSEMQEESAVPKMLEQSISEAIGEPLIGCLNRALSILEKFIDNRSEEFKTKHILTGKVFSWVTVIIVIVVTILAATKIISSDSFTFVIGTIVGYLAMYVKLAFKGRSDE
jgi:phage-related minor tail protein